jgi:hypothetical protein
MFISMISVTATAMHDALIHGVVIDPSSPRTK